MEIKTSDLWIYNFDKFDYWFSQRPLNIKLPLSIFYMRRSRKIKNAKLNSESFLISLLFYLYTQRGDHDASVCKSTAVRQVLSRGANLVEIKFNKTPFIYSAYLCGVYEFNNTIAVKLGFKKDGLIKVSKKNFTRLFVENEFYTQNYAFVDLISCPPVGFDNKFLDFELVVPEIPKFLITNMKRKNIIIPDCIVFVKRSKTFKYAFSSIINLGEIQVSQQSIKYSKKRIRRYLNVLKRVKKPYIFKFFILFSRLIFSALYFNNRTSVLNSNLYIYKIHIVLKRIWSFYKIFKSFIRKRYFKLHSFKWYKQFRKLFSRMLNNIKHMLKYKRSCLVLRKPVYPIILKNNLQSKILNMFAFFSKKELVLFDLMGYSQVNCNFFSVLFSGGKYLVTKYSVRRLRDFHFKNYFLRKVRKVRKVWKFGRGCSMKFEKLMFKIKFKRLKLRKKFKLLKKLKLYFKQKFKRRKYVPPKIINLSVPLNQSNHYKSILPYYNLFFYKSKHNLMSQGNIENLGFFRVKKKLNLIIPRRHYYKYRAMVAKFLKNYSRTLNVLFLRNLKKNISALHKDFSLNSVESALIIRRLLKANKRRLVYLFCFKHYRSVEKKRKAKIRKLLKLRRLRLRRLKGIHRPAKQS